MSKKLPSSGKPTAIDNLIKELEKYPVLTNEQECSLFQQMRNGDKNAIVVLTMSNMGFVISVAKGFQHLGLDMEELISAGKEGLLEAINRFDETHGTRLCTYAGWWIRKRIMEALREACPVALSQKEYELRAKIFKADRELRQELERKPTNYEIKERLIAYGVKESVNIDGLVFIVTSTNKVEDHDKDFDEVITSDDITDPDAGSGKLDDPMVISSTDEADAEPAETGDEDDNDGIDAMSLVYEGNGNGCIWDAFKRLEEQEQRVLSLKYGLEGNTKMKNTEISTIINKSPQRVGQIAKEALEKLRKFA